MARLKEKIGQAWAACKGFLVKRWPWVVVAPVLLALAIAGYWVSWTGFDQRTGTVPEENRAKILWDSLDLLLVPVLLALGAWLLNRAAREREQEAEERRIEEQQRIKLDRSREAAWQTYLDRVSALLRSVWRETGESFVEAGIIRAQTLTVLRQLDGKRRAQLLQFLYESGLIGGMAGGSFEKRYEALVDLLAVNLEQADLIRADPTSPPTSTPVTMTVRWPNEQHPGSVGSPRAARWPSPRAASRG